MGINKSIFSGNIGQEPELRSTPSGMPILTFSLAVTDRVKNKQSGEWENYTNWMNCIMFGSRAESVAKLIGKGSKVVVECKARWSQWEKDGVKRSKTEFIVDEIEFLSQATQGAQRDTQSQQSDSSPYDEDIPF